MDVLRHHFRPANGIRFHFVECGFGPPVVLLHGFPEFWYSWRHQLPALSVAGYRAIAPDLRGYNLTQRPAGITAYRPRTLVADVASFIQDIVGEPVCLVGHDWGGVLAWRCAMLYPQHICKLLILNAPHPAARQQALQNRPSLWLQARYMLPFLLPWLPERMLQANDFARLERIWRQEPVHPGAFTDEDIARYKDAFRGADALTGPLNFYRAAFRFSRDLLAEPQTVSVPTRVLWAEQDPYLSVYLIESLSRWVPDLDIRRVPDSSHWIQNDVPELVNREMLDFFR